MSKDDDNLESLEQELKALKKKKLQKELIYFIRVKLMKINEWAKEHYWKKKHGN